MQITDAQYLIVKQEKPHKKIRIESNNLNPTKFTSQNRPNTKAEKLSDRISQSLELNEAESKIIFDLCEERANKIEKIKLNSDNSSQKLSDIQMVNQIFDQKIRNLVTATQYQKYETLKKAGN